MTNKVLELPCGTKIKHTHFISDTHKGHQLAVTDGYESGTIMDITTRGDHRNVDSAIIRIDCESFPMIIKYLQEIMDEEHLPMSEEITDA